MLEWARNLLGIGRSAAVERAKVRAYDAIAKAHNAITARYDNAQYTDENQRTLWMTDWLSAKSANNYQVRRRLRNWSRYEVSNNPFLFGVCTGYADDLIGEDGPTLQCLRSSASENQQIEAVWNEWCAEVESVEKLRTYAMAEVVDGEGFLVLKTVRDMEHPVKLYPVDVEADQVTTPAPKDLEELWVDGLILHPVTHRPVAFDVLKSHPGDYFFPGFNPLDFDRIRAEFVLHSFFKFRPGQVRGVPVFTPSLDMFSDLRSYRKAVLAKANIAANFTGVIESADAPADGDDTDTPEPMDTIATDRGTMKFLPAGWKATLFPAGEPSTTYDAFQEKCLGEAVRPLSYPLILALGTSQKANFSSAKLDFTAYRNGLTVRRGRYGRETLTRLFRAFLRESLLVPGLLPRSIRSPADVPHEWHWQGFESLDPVADAEADKTRLESGMQTWQQFWAARGYDWRKVMQQQAAEREEITRLKLVFGDKPQGEQQKAPPAKRKESASAAA